MRLLGRLSYVLSVMQVIFVCRMHHPSAESSFSTVNVLSSYLNMKDADKKLDNGAIKS